MISHNIYRSKEVFHEALSHRNSPFFCPVGKVVGVRHWQIVVESPQRAREHYVPWESAILTSEVRLAVMALLAVIAGCISCASSMWFRSLVRWREHQLRKLNSQPRRLHHVDNWLVCARPRWRCHYWLFRDSKFFVVSASVCRLFLSLSLCMCSSARQPVYIPFFQPHISTMQYKRGEWVWERERESADESLVARESHSPRVVFRGSIRQREREAKRGPYATPYNIAAAAAAAVGI